MKFLASLFFTLPFFIPQPVGIQVEKEDGFLDEIPTIQQLFEEEEVLELVIRGDTRSLLRDRSDEAEYHQMELIYKTKDSGELVHSLKIKTRGNFRRKRSNCYYPPLLLNFPKKNIPENSVFSGQNKLKLVTACKGEKYVVREYLAYKLYNLLTDYSFKARLVRVVFEDTVKRKKSQPFYSIILEDEDQMAKRNAREIKKIDQVKPEDTDREFFLKMSVFQYLIANTDWSTQYRQNIKLLYGENAQSPIPVPYDFDHAGIVSAPYAMPPTELKLKSLKDRRYRGFCLEGEKEALGETLIFFREKKADIYKVYQDCPFLKKRYKKSTRKFLDEFYKTLDNDSRRKAAFSYPCHPNGTGNVIIKGLRN